MTQQADPPAPPTAAAAPADAPRPPETPTEASQAPALLPPAIDPTRAKDAADRPRPKPPLALTLTVAAMAALLVAAGVRVVHPGQAIILTLLGHPTRVITQPGPVLTWPPPIGGAILVDTRLQTTQGTVQRLHPPPSAKDSSAPGPWLAQPYAIWRVAPDPAAIRLFAQAAGRAGLPPAQTIRDLLDSALPAALDAALQSGLANPQSRAAALDAAAAALTSRIAPAARTAYGIEITAAGLMQLARPAGTPTADATQQAAEAARKHAEAVATAAQIRSEAERDSRIALADADVEAASIEADARKEAAAIEGKAYSSDPELYQMLRSLDTLSTMVGPSTRLVLRTDAAPFNVLVQGPPTEPGK